MYFMSSYAIFKYKAIFKWADSITISTDKC